MNKEVPPSLKGQYSMVLDGGTLEHVFNFPVAIKNCMEMLRVGGHYIGITPTNNFMGHGFYQFSPELYCSIFTRENGFELVSVVAFEDTARAAWYSCADYCPNSRDAKRRPFRNPSARKPVVSA